MATLVFTRNRSYDPDDQRDPLLMLVTHGIPSPGTTNLTGLRAFWSATGAYMLRPSPVTWHGLPVERAWNLIDGRWV